MLASRTFLGVALALAMAEPALSAETTPDGARSLQDAFELYLGKPAAGEAGVVAVTPDGEAYRVALDMQKLMQPLATLGLKLGAATFTFHASPLDDGHWRVNDVTFPDALHLDMGNQSTSYTFDGLRYEGIYDPKLAGFIQGTGAVGKMTTETTAAQMNASLSYADSAFEQKGQKVAEGVMSLDAHQTVGSIVETVKGSPGGDPALANFGFTFKSAGATVDVAIAALHSVGLLDVWASALAHGSHLEEANELADFKGKLLASLPIVDSFKETGTINDIGVETSVGTFAMKQMAVQIDGTGLVAAGHFGFGLRTAGLAVPDNLLSPWQKSLVPTDFDIGASVDGLDLDAGARAIIAALDFSKEPIIVHKVEPGGSEVSFSKPIVDHDALPAITAAFLHNGPLKVTIPSSHIVSASLQLEFKGEVTITQPIPYAHLDVSAKGLDATMEMLKSAMQTNPSDPLAPGALSVLGMAANLGKPGPDGTVAWAIDLGSDGAVVVNGTPIGGK